MEESRNLVILLPSDKFTLQWIDLARNVEVLNIHNNIFDEPRKKPRKRELQKLTPKTPRKIFY
jgi:hypothetical protein